MAAGPPINNKNAEKWTIELATHLFDKALELSKDREYDFIGEIARDLDQYKEVFTYLSDRFPELKMHHKRIVVFLFRWFRYVYFSWLVHEPKHCEHP